MEEGRPASYLETIWGRTIAVICREEWEGPRFPVLSPAPSPSGSLPSPQLLLGSTPLAPSPWAGSRGTTPTGQSYADRGLNPSSPRLTWATDMMLQFMTSESLWRRNRTIVRPSTNPASTPTFSYFLAYFSFKMDTFFFFFFFRIYNVHTL